jgi:hypothetical protein
MTIEPSARQTIYTTHQKPRYAKATQPRQLAAKAIERDIEKDPALDALRSTQGAEDQGRRSERPAGRWETVFPNRSAPLGDKPGRSNTTPPAQPQASWSDTRVNTACGSYRLTAKLISGGPSAQPLRWIHSAVWSSDWFCLFRIHPWKTAPRGLHSYPKLIDERMQSIPRKPISRDERDLLTQAAGLIKIQRDLKGFDWGTIQNPRNTAEGYALQMAPPSYDEELAFINNLIGQAEC